MAKRTKRLRELFILGFVLSACLCIYYGTYVSKTAVLQSYTQNIIPLSISNTTIFEIEAISSAPFNSTNKIFDISCGCTATTSLFQFFTQINSLNGFRVPMINNYDSIANISLLSRIPPSSQYIYGLKLCDEESIAIEIVKQLETQNAHSIFVLFVRPLSSYVKCSINETLQSNKTYSTDSSHKNLATHFISRWFYYHCNVIDYFRNTSKLILFDVEKDPLSMLKNAFYNLTNSQLVGNISDAKHHSDAQSALISLNSFCDLYIDREPILNPPKKKKKVDLEYKGMNKKVPTFTNKIFDISPGCTGTTSIFKYFTRMNNFKGLHYNKGKLILKDLIYSNFMANVSLLTGIPSNYQYLSDLKLMNFFNLGVEIVKKIQKQNPDSIFILLVRRLSDHVKCRTFFRFQGEPSYKRRNSTRKYTATQFIGVWFNYYCNIIDYFREISQIEKLIIFDLERDPLSLLKDAFFNISKYELIGDVPKINHHSDHTVNVQEQSAKIFLNSFCDLYVDTI